MKKVSKVVKLGFIGILFAIAIAIIASLQIVNVNKSNLKDREMNLSEEERLFIDKLKAENDDNPESTIYLVTDEVISRVRPETTVESFKGNMEQGVELYTNNDATEKVESGIVKTGMYAVYTQNGRKYEISVVGDIDGDGKATQIDLTHMIRYAQNSESRIEGEVEKKAGDIVVNGEIDREDIDWMIEYLVFGRGNIENPNQVESPKVEVIDGDQDLDRDYKTDVTVKITEQNISSQTEKTVYKISGDMETEYTVIPENGEITLTQDGIYKITAYTYGIEGNKSKGASLIIKKETKVIESPIITAEPTDWTNENVNVTITVPEGYEAEKGYEIKYKTSLSEEYRKYEEPFEVSENCMIYAILTDGTIESDETEYEVTNIDKIDPQIAVNPEKIEVSNDKIVLKVEGTDNESGLGEIKVYLNEEIKGTYDYKSEDRKSVEETVELTDLEPDKEYKYYAVVYDKAGNTNSTEEKTIKTLKIGTPIIEAEPTEWTKEDVTVRITKPEGYGEEYIIEYKKEGEEVFSTYTNEFTVDSNTKIIARIRLGEEYGAEAEKIINNIDKVNPTIEVQEENKTTRSLDIKMSGQDKESGIKETTIYFREKGQEEYEKTEYNYEPGEDGEYSKDIKIETYEGRDLKANTVYEYYIEVEDRVGNKTTTTAKETTTNKIPSMEELGITISHEPTEWTKEAVTVTINETTQVPEEFTLEYKIEGEEYAEYTESFSQETNTKVYARITDGISSNEEITHDITNIDKIVPEIKEEQLGERKTDGFKLTVKAQDNESGLKAIRVFVDGEKAEEQTYEGNTSVGYTTEEQTKEFEINGIEQNQGHTYYTEVEDGVGNITTSEQKTVTTTEIPTLEDLGITISHTPLTWTNEAVTVTINNVDNAKPEYEVEYLISDTIPELEGSEWQTYESEFPVEENKIVYARITDGKNAGESTAHEIENIDTTNPEGTIEEKNKQTNGFSLNVTNQDEQSGMKEMTITVTDEEGSEINTQNYTYEGNQVGEEKLDKHTEEYVLDGLDQNKKYKVKVTIEDQAGNKIELDEKEITTSSVPTLDATITHEPTEWTNEEVEVTIERQTEQRFDIEYKTSEEPGASWTPYVDKFNVANNTTVHARLTDGKNTGDEITHEIENIDTTLPVAGVQVNSTTSNSFKITATGTDRESGIAKIEIQLLDGDNPIDTQTQEYAGNQVGEPSENIQTKEYEKTNLDKNKKYTIKVIVTDKAGNEQETTTNVTTLDIGESNLSVTHTPTNWTHNEVEVEITSDKLADNLKIQYKEAENEDQKETAVWQEYNNKFKVSKNEIVYVRITDGNNTGVEIEHKIENIDTVNPSVNVETENVTTRSVDFKVTGIDNESGLKTIKIYTKEKNGAYEFNEYTYKGNEVGSPKEDKSEKTYTLNELKQNTVYEYYAEVIDQADNRATTVAKEVTTGTIPSMDELGIKITHNPTEWTKEPVEVTINKESDIPEGLTLQYKVSGGRYEEYTDKFDQETNTTVYAKVTDGVNSNTEITHEITNIDKAFPKIIEESVEELKTDSFSLQFKLQDNESGLKATRIFVDGEQVKEQPYEGNLTEGYSKNLHTVTFKYSGLEENHKYTYYIEVEDGVGNVTTSEQKTVTTGKLPELDATISHSPTNWTNNEVTVEIRKNVEIPTNYTLQYKTEKEDGDTIEDWQPYTNTFKMQENGKVLARITDGNNNGDEEEHIINNIDKTDPTKAEISQTEVKADRVKFNVTGKDSESGLKEINITIKDNEEHTAGTKKYTYGGNPVGVKGEYERTETAEIGGLRQGTEYSYTMEVVDQAGNTKSTEKQNFTTVQIPDPKVEITHEPTNWTKNGVTVTINQTETQEGYTLQYKTVKASGETIQDWDEYTSSFEMQENGKVLVRLADDNENYGNSKEHKIENIDKQNPTGEIGIQNKKTNGFTLNLTANDDFSGLKEMSVTITNDEDEQVGTNTYQYDGNQVGSPKKDSHTEEYTIGELKANTTYKAKVTIKDQADNEIQLDEKEITTGEVPAINATITHKPTNWTKNDVTVTINQTEDQEGYTVQYKEDEGEWNPYQRSFSAHQNETVYARLTEGTNGGSEISHEIQNIDKQDPTGTLTINPETITMNSFEVNLKAQDNESGLKVIKIYTKGEGEERYTETTYDDYKGNEIGSEKEDKTDITLKIDEAVANKQYEIYATIEDQAGNIKTLGTQRINTKEMKQFTGIITHKPPTEWTNNDVDVTITPSEELTDGLSIEYRVEDEEGREVENWTPYEKEFKVANNGKVKARLTDKKNKSNEIEHEITNIDKVPPEIDPLTTNEELGTKKQIVIHATDNNGIVGYGVTQLETEPEYTEYEENKELQINVDVNEIGTYYVWVKDVAGNTDKEQIEIDEIYREPVAKIEETEETFFSLASAIAKVKEYEQREVQDPEPEDPKLKKYEHMTITMLKNVKETNKIDEELNVTINLNGKTILGDSGVEATIKVDNGRLTIVDKVEVVEETEEPSEQGPEVTIGRVINETTVAIEVTENGTLTLGEIEEQLEVSTETPNIVGNENGVKTKGIFNFYDGKIEGQLAIDGEVKDTPHLYSASVSREDESSKQVAILVIQSDAVAKIEETNKYYTQFPLAVVECPDNERRTITILKTITSTDEITLENKDIVIDLAGQTFGMNGIENNGKLEITDSTEGQLGVLKNEGTSVDNIISNTEAGTLVISGGTLLNTSAGNSSKYKNVIYNEGELTVKGGILNETQGYSNGIYNKTGTLTMENGQIKGTCDGIRNESKEKLKIMGGSISTYSGIKQYSSGPTEITGGSITGNSEYGIYNDSTEKLVINGDNVTVTGKNYGIYNKNTGKIEINGENAIVSGEDYGIYNNSDGEIEITAGTIKQSTDSSYREYSTIYNNGIGNINLIGEKVNITGKRYGVYNYNTATINISDCNITVTNASGVYNNSSGAVNISNATIKGYSGITNVSGTMEITDINLTSTSSYGYGINNTGNGNVKLNSGTINSKGSGIINSNIGLVQIQNATITSTEKRGIENNSTGTIEIFDGTITGATSGIINDKEGSISIRGGHITGNNYGISNNGTGTITIGNKEDEGVNTVPEITGTTIIGISNVTGTVNWYDGIITGPIDKAFEGEITEIPTECEVEITKDETLEHAILTNDPKEVAQVGDMKFKTVKEAVKYCNENSSGELKEIEMINNAVIATENSKAVIETGKNIQIDLKGFEIRGLSSKAYIENQGQLKITDTGDSGKILYADGNCIHNIGELELLESDISSAKANAIKNEEEGITTVTSGTIQGTISGIINDGTGDVIIDGGTIKNGVVNNNTGNIILNNGTIETKIGYSSDKGYGIKNKSTGKVEMTGGIIDLSEAEPSNYVTGIYNVSGGEVNITGGRIQKTNDDRCYAFGIDNEGSGKILSTQEFEINIRCCPYDSGYFYGIINRSTGIIDIQNAHIDVTQRSGIKYAIYNSKTGTVNITNSELSANTTIYNIDGTVNVLGGNINNLGSKGIDNEGVGEISLENTNITSTGSNGIYNAKSGKVIVKGETTANSTSTGIYNETTGTIEILSGTIKTTRGESIYNKSTGTIQIGDPELPVNEDLPNITGTTSGVYNSTTGTLKFYDGQITGAKEKSISGTVSETPEEYEIIIIDNQNETETSKLSNSVVTAKIDEQEYKSLQLAIDAVENDKDEVTTITMLRSVKASQENALGIIDEHKKIRLDIAGYTINQNGSTSVIENSGELEIIDSKSETGTGNITNLTDNTIVNTGKLDIKANIISSGTNSCAIKNQEDGIVTVTSGTIQGTLSGIINDGTGAVTIDGGNIINGAINNNTGNIVFNNGTIQVKASRNSNDRGYGIKNVSTGTIEMTGGTINLPSADEASYLIGIYNISEGEVNITGGTIQKTNTSSYYAYGIFNAGKGKITSTKGLVIDITGDTYFSYSYYGIINSSTGIVDIQNTKIYVDKRVGTKYAIYNTGAGTFNITNSELSSNTAIYNNDAGTINVVGGNITTLGDYGIHNAKTGKIIIKDGTTLNSTYKGIYNESTGTIEFLSGTIKATNSQGIYNNSTGTIQIGNPDEPVSEELPSITGTANGVYNSITGTLKFYSGEIIGAKNQSIEGPITEIPDTYEVIKTNDETQETAILGKDVPTARINQETYTSIEDAISHVEENQEEATTIEILRNITIVDDSKKVVIPENKKIKLNLAGYIVSGSNCTAVIENNGDLEIIEEGSNTSQILSYTGKTINNNSNGILKIKQGIITSQKNGNSDNYNYIILNKGKMDFDGGTLQINKDYTMGIRCTENGTLTFKSGTLSGITNNSNVYYIYNYEGKVEMLGGKIEGYNNYGVGIYNVTGEVDITGGSINKCSLATRNSSNGTVTLENVSIDSNHGVYNNSGIVTVKSGTTLKTGFEIIENYGSGEVILEGATITCTNDYYGNIENTSTGTIRIKDGTTINIASSIVNSKSGNIEITGGTITSSERTLMFNEGTGTVEIKGGSLTSSKNRVISNRETGNVIIERGTLTSNSSDAVYNYIGNITITEGDIIGNCGVYNDCGKVEITGGTITSTSSKGIYNERTGTIKITGGTIKGVDGVYNNSTGTITIGIADQRINQLTPSIIATGYGIYNKNDSGHLYFYDGTVTGGASKSTYGTISLEENIKISKTTNEDGTETAILLSIGTNMDVAIVKGVYYRSLQEAVLACGAEGTILIANTTEIPETILIKPETNITIELNGCTLTFNVEEYAIQNNGNLTIKGSGSLINSVGGVIDNIGELTIGESTDSVSEEPKIIGTTTGIKNTGTINFYDGEISGQTAVDGEINTWQDGYRVEKENDQDRQTAKLVSNTAGIGELNLQNEVYMMPRSPKEEKKSTEEDEEDEEEEGLSEEETNNQPTEENVEAPIEKTIETEETKQINQDTPDI